MRLRSDAEPRLPPEDELRMLAAIAKYDPAWWIVVVVETARLDVQWTEDR